MMILLLALSLLSVQDRTVDPATELAAVRTLYGSAAFDEALARLSRFKAPDALQDQADTYRALCLLALGRAREAEDVVQELLQRNPKYLPDEADVSPKLILVFRSVRARLLPEAAKALYVSARATFDATNFELASTQFRELLLMIGDANEGGLGDLRLLAEGFMKLGDAARSNAPAGVNPASLVTPDPAAKSPVYSILDRDVVAPVEITRMVPTMVTPRGTQPALYQGLIEVIINENGRVESATVKRSITAAFDAELLAAAETWRFQPATRNALPVKYRRAYEIIGHSR
jgi:TonB family protein